MGRENHSWPYYCNYHFYNLSKMTNLTVRLLLDYNSDVTWKFSISGTKYFQMNPLFQVPIFKGIIFLFETVKPYSAVIC